MVAYKGWRGLGRTEAALADERDWADPGVHGRAWGRVYPAAALAEGGAAVSGDL